jgi:hypothetical protein
MSRSYSNPLTILDGRDTPGNAFGRTRSTARADRGGGPFEPPKTRKIVKIIHACDDLCAAGRKSRAARDTPGIAFGRTRSTAQGDGVPTTSRRTSWPKSRCRVVPRQRLSGVANCSPVLTRRRIQGRICSYILGGYLSLADDHASMSARNRVSSGGRQPGRLAHVHGSEFLDGRVAQHQPLDAGADAEVDLRL